MPSEQTSEKVMRKAVVYARIAKTSDKPTHRMKAFERLAKLQKGLLEMFSLHINGPSMDEEGVRARFWTINREIENIIKEMETIPLYGNYSDARNAVLDYLEKSLTQRALDALRRIEIDSNFQETQKQAHRCLVRLGDKKELEKLIEWAKEDRSRLIPATLESEFQRIKTVAPIHERLSEKSNIGLGRVQRHGEKKSAIAALRELAYKKEYEQLQTAITRNSDSSVRKLAVWALAEYIQRHKRNSVLFELYERGLYKLGSPRNQDSYTFLRQSLATDVEDWIGIPLLFPQPFDVDEKDAENALYWLRYAATRCNFLDTAWQLCYEFERLGDKEGLLLLAAYSKLGQTLEKRFKGKNTPHGYFDLLCEIVEFLEPSTLRQLISMSNFKDSALLALLKILSLQQTMLWGTRACSVDPSYNYADDILRLLYSPERILRGESKMADDYLKLLRSIKRPSPTIISEVQRLRELLEIRKRGVEKLPASSIIPKPPPGFLRPPPLPIIPGDSEETKKRKEEEWTEFRRREEEERRKQEEAFAQLLKYFEENKEQFKEERKKREEEEAESKRRHAEATKKLREELIAELASREEGLREAIKEFRKLIKRKLDTQQLIAELKKLDPELDISVEELEKLAEKFKELEE